MKCNAAPYEGSEPFVFISYCHADEGIVYPYIEMLAKRGYRVWYDEGINPGEEWPEVIAKHLDEATYFIAFMSENSVKSHNCKREVNFAIQKRKAFMAIFLEEVKLSLGLEMALSTVQALRRDQFKTHDECLNRVCKNAVLNWCLGEPNSDIVVQNCGNKVIHVKEKSKQRNETYSYEKFFLEDKVLSKKKNVIEHEPKKEQNSNTLIFSGKTKDYENTYVQKTSFSKDGEVDSKRSLETKPKLEYKEVKVEPVKEICMKTISNKADENSTEKQIQYFDEEVGGDNGETMLNPIFEDETVLNPTSEIRYDYKPNKVLIRISNNETIILNKKIFSIGRSLNDDYTIEDDKSIISRKHISLIYENNRVYVIDNNSKNHTYVNGKQIESKTSVELNDFDIIEIGNERLLCIENLQNEEDYNKAISVLKNDQISLMIPQRRVIRIGRLEESNDIIIKSNKISRNHAILIRKNNDLFVLDLNSSNGTYVNDEEVKYGDKRILLPGDCIAFGSIRYNVI